MKKLFCVFFVLLLAFSASAADLDNILFEAESPSLTGTYPRFATLQDGTLLLAVGGGRVYRSADDGDTWTESKINADCGTAVSPLCEAHIASGNTIGYENWQPYVMDDGTVLMAYRARTAGYVADSGEPFYTSIRIMTSADGGLTFGNEQIITESVTDAFKGYWEPTMLQLNADTLAVYYSNDLRDYLLGANYQDIDYVTYDVGSIAALGAWKETGRGIALDGSARQSRDGMPAVVRLRSGGYALVAEAYDYRNRNYFAGGKKENCLFVTMLSLSEDGIRWRTPVPVLAPEDIYLGQRAAAPYIASLPDGRVVISCMSESNFIGDIYNSSPSRNCVYEAVISDKPLTLDTVLIPTTGLGAEGFTHLSDLFDDPENGFMMWNTVYANDEHLYFAGGAGINIENGGAGVSNARLRLRRADIRGTVQSGDENGDGSVNVADAMLTLQKFLNGGTFDRADMNCDGRYTLPDILRILKKII